MCTMQYQFATRYLHFVNNDSLPPRDSPGYDRLGKVRPIIDQLSTSFAEQYQPGRDIAVDEAMLKFQGRSSLKQYLPMKPIKRGIKVWVLGDSSNGYFSRLEVYTGKVGDSTETGLGARVVKTLTADLRDKNHHVFFDNFFNSFQLLLDLLDDGLYGCGTARSNRKGFPAELKNTKLKNRYDVCTHALHVHAWTYTCAHTHTHAHNTHTRTHMHTHTTHTHMHTHTAHTHAHTCAHTHT